LLGSLGHEALENLPPVRGGSRLGRSSARGNAPLLERLHPCRSVSEEERDKFFPVIKFRDGPLVWAIAGSKRRPRSEWALCPECALVQRLGLEIRVERELPGLVKQTAGIEPELPLLLLEVEATTLPEVEPSPTSAKIEGPSASTEVKLTSASKIEPARTEVESASRTAPKIEAATAERLTHTVWDIGGLEFVGVLPEKVRRSAHETGGAGVRGRGMNRFVYVNGRAR